MVMMIVIACYRQGRGWEGQDELCQLCQAKKMADLLRGHPSKRLYNIYIYIYNQIFKEVWLTLYCPSGHNANLGS